MLRNVLLLLTLFVFFYGIPVRQRNEEKISILFVGNSLTYTNDLPALVAEIAKQDGVTINYQSFLFPDYSLEDHWKEGKVTKEIQNGRYDFVVAQQGPSALPESQVLLFDFAAKFAEQCKASQSKLALYMVWPSRARSFDHDNVIQSYTKAADRAGALLCPAGLAWKYAWEKNGKLSLYGKDNFHPGIDGSVLAALTIYGRLTAKENFDFLNRGTASWKNDISPETFEILQEAALKAITR